MRTENDLYEAIEELAERAVGSADLISAVRTRTQPQADYRPAPRQVMAPLLAAVATVVVVAAGVVGVASLRGDDSRSPSHVGAVAAVPNADQPCATSNEPSFTTFTIGPVPGVARPTDVTAFSCSGYSSQSISSTGLQGVKVVVYGPGVFRTSLLNGTRTVTGHGVQGHLGTVDTSKNAGSCLRTGRGAGELADPVGSLSCAMMAGMAWEYASNAWAVLVAASSDRSSYGAGAKVWSSDQMLALAAAVRVDQGKDLRVPFRLTDLAGLKPVAAFSGGVDEPDMAVAGFAGAGEIYLAEPGTGVGCPRPAACQAAVTIDVQSTPDKGLPTGTSGRRLTINGHPAIYRAGAPESPSQPRTYGSITMSYNHWQIFIQVVAPHSGLSQAGLIRLAQGLTLIESPAHSTWIAIRDALPR